MKLIGFANKYFTLWFKGEEYHPIHGNITKYTYIQNLSMDESKAIEKAKDKGVTNLVPDVNLRGQSSSFFIKTDKPVVKNADEFPFGKYVGNTISTNTDASYMFWMYNQLNIPQRELHGEIMLNRVLELTDSYVVHNEQLMEVWRKDKIVAQENQEVEVDKLVETNTPVEVTFLSNFGNELVTTDLGKLGVRSIPSKMMYYQGYEYYLPYVNGKAKRIKNKKAKIILGKTDDINSPTYYIKEFELL